jgi:LysM repeat protein
VQNRIFIRWFLLFPLLIGALNTTAIVKPAQQRVQAAPYTQVTAFDLIIAMNTLRVSYGLPALVEDPIINAVAQSTAETMAANQMSWHIGNVSGRLTAAGYGGGATVWATENFAVGNLSIDEIMVIWSDASHMIPAVNPAYCNIGAGVARSSNGRYYYVLQAAYTSAKSCGEYKSPGTIPEEHAVSQWIVPVKIATPDADGNVYHEVEYGQSFWAIAIAYKITIHDLEIWNNLSRDTELQVGQRLFIPGPNTEGYHTPTPVGMIQISTPDSDGKIIHIIQEYQTLIAIAQAYGTKIDKIVSLNGIQSDWPLQIGQKLLIDPGRVTPSPTPRPLTPLEKLTPADDGNYYHTVKEGENLSWIADLYDVRLDELMAWNGLSDSSVLQPEQLLLLKVTPPATETGTPSQIIATSTSTVSPPTRTSTLLPTMSEISKTPTEVVTVQNAETIVVLAISIGVILGGTLFFIFLSRKKR